MPEEKTLLYAVLVWLIRDGKVSLAEKAGRIGQGRLNGYGGGIEGEEDQKVAVCRETLEECKVVVRPEDLTKVAVVDFHNTKTDQKTFVCQVHVFIAYEWQGEPVETEEMLNPQWYEIANLPYDRMMPGDFQWIPPVLIDGKKIKAKLSLGPFQKELLSPVVIEEVELLE